MVPWEARVYPTNSKNYRNRNSIRLGPNWLLDWQLTNNGKFPARSFWKTPRSRCPATAKPSVLTCIRVPNKNGDWLPISNLWLDDDSKVDCFGGLLKEWDRPWTDTKRKTSLENLKIGIFGIMGTVGQDTAQRKTPSILAQSLRKSHRGCFLLVFDTAFEASRRPLDDGWKHIVQEAEKTAVRRLLTARWRRPDSAAKK